MGGAGGTRRKVGFASAGRTYAMLVVAAASSLLVGLGLPFVLGDPAGTPQTLGVGGFGSPDGTSSSTPTMPLSTSTTSTAAASLPRGGGGTGATVPGGGGQVTTTTQPAGGTPGTSPSGEPLTASDQGVTPERIKIGVLFLNEAQYTGNTAVLGDARESWQPYIDDLNARGGVLGRQLEVVYRPFDPLSSADRRAACLELTEDKKVFAAFNTQFYDAKAMLCLTQEHQVPYLAYNVAGSDEYYQESGGYLFTMDMSWHRSLRNMAQRAHDQRLLQGKKIGVLDVDYDPAAVQAVDGALLPALDGLGYSVTHRSTLGNAQTAPSQIPVQVQQMKAKGVQVVLLAGALLQNSQFVQQAEAQRFTPQWVVSDMFGQATDTGTQLMPASYAGAIAYTALRTGEHRVGAPEPAPDAECRAVYERANGKALGRGSTAYVTAMGACTLIARFEAAATAAGATLTRSGLSSALQGQVSFAIPFYGGGSFGPGKFAAADLLRTLRWDAVCRCWNPVDEFGPAVP